MEKETFPLYLTAHGFKRRDLPPVGDFDGAVQYLRRKYDGITVSIQEGYKKRQSAIYYEDEIKAFVELGEKEYIKRQNLNCYRNLRQKIEDLNKAIGEETPPHTLVSIQKEINRLSVLILPLEEWLLQNGCESEVITDSFKVGKRLKNQAKSDKERIFSLLENLSQEENTLNEADNALRKHKYFKRYRTLFIKARYGSNLNMIVDQLCEGRAMTTDELREQTGATKYFLELIKTYLISACNRPKGQFNNRVRPKSLREVTERMRRQDRSNASVRVLRLV